MNHILQNLNLIHQRMQHACKNSGRQEKEVRLLLATKTVSAENILIALEAGEQLIGENKVQELKEKYEELIDQPHKAHFIGHLQTNKINEVLKFADCIESVDRLDLVQKLDRRLQFEGRQLEIFMQVNTSYEESKFGVSPEESLNLIRQISNYDTLKVKGLMTIGLFTSEHERLRRCFQQLKNIQSQIIELNLPNVEMHELSMGMSGDLEIAIEEGATIVRVGTAIFGKRIYPDSYYWNETN